MISSSSSSSNSSTVLSGTTRAHRTLPTVSEYQPVPQVIFHCSTTDAQACNLLRLPMNSCQASAKLLKRPLPLSLSNPCCAPATRSTALLPWLTSLYSTKRRRCSASCRVIPTLRKRHTRA